MKEVFEGLFSGIFIRDYALAKQILGTCPAVSDASKGYLARKRFLNKGTPDRDIVRKVLRDEGMSLELFPLAMYSFEDGDAVVKKQQELIEALAPAMYDGMVLCARTPASEGNTSFYGFRVKGGKACRLRVRLEEY